MKSKHSRLEQKAKNYHFSTEDWQLDQDEAKELERRQQVLQGLNELNQSDPGGARAIPDIVFHNISPSRQRQLAEEHPARDSQGASVGHLDYVGAIKEGLNDEEFAALENSFHAYINLPAELQQKWQSDLRASKPDSDKYKTRREYERAHTVWTAEGLCSLNKLAKEAQAKDHIKPGPKPAPRPEKEPRPATKIEVEHEVEVQSVVSPKADLKPESSSEKLESKPTAEQTKLNSAPTISEKTQAKTPDDEWSTEMLYEQYKKEGYGVAELSRQLLAKDREPLGHVGLASIAESDEELAELIEDAGESYEEASKDINGDMSTVFPSKKDNIDKKVVTIERVKRLEQLSDFLKRVDSLSPDVAKAIVDVAYETDPANRDAGYHDDYDGDFNLRREWAEDVATVIRKETSTDESERSRGKESDEAAEQYRQLPQRLSSLGRQEGYDAVQLILALAHDPNSNESHEELERLGQDSRYVDDVLNGFGTDQRNSAIDLLDKYNILPDSWKKWWALEHRSLLDDKKYQSKDEYRNALDQGRAQLCYLGKLFEVNKERHARNGDGDLGGDWASEEKRVDWRSAQNRLEVADQIDSLSDEPRRLIELYLWKACGVQPDIGTNKLSYYYDYNNDLLDVVNGSRSSSEEMDELSDLVNKVAILAISNPQKLTEIADKFEQRLDRTEQAVTKYNEGNNSFNARLNKASSFNETIEGDYRLMKSELCKALKSIPRDLTTGDGSEKNAIDGGNDKSDDQGREQSYEIARASHYPGVSVAKASDDQNRHSVKVQRELWPSVHNEQAWLMSRDWGEKEISAEYLPKFREKMSKYVGEQVLNDKMRSELLKQAFIRPLGQERMAELQQQYRGEVNSAAEMIVKSIQDADGLNSKECYQLNGLLNDLDALPDSDVRRVIQSVIFKNGVANARNRSETEDEGSDFSAELRDLIHQKAERIRQTGDLRREYQNASLGVRNAVDALVNRDKFSRCDESSRLNGSRGRKLVDQLGGKSDGLYDTLMSKDGISLLTEDEVASYRKHLAMVKELSADSINELLDFDDDLDNLKDGVVPPDVRKVLEKYQDGGYPGRPKKRRAYNQAQAELYQMEIDKVNELAKANRAELEEFLAPRRKLTDQIFNKNVDKGAMSLLYTELMMKSFSKERYEEVIETFRNARNGKRTDFGDFIQCRNASEPSVPDPRGMTQEEFERLAELTPLVLGLSKSQVKQLLESEEKEKTRLSKGDPNDPELWQKRQQYSATLEQRIRRMVRDNDAENVNMASVDRSRIVEMKAYIDAKRKLDKELTPKPEDLNAKGKLKLGARVRGAVARLWKGKIFRDYYEFKYQRELKEQYSKDFAHTLGVNSGDGSASSAETEQALIWRMTQDSDFFTDTVGEEREQLSPDSEAYKAMRRAVKTFVKNGNEEAFIEEARRINNDLMGDEGMPILDNYLTSAIYIKGQVDHGRALNDVMRGFKMYRGISAEGVNSGHHERAIDKLVAKFERKKTGETLFIKPEVVAGAAGLAGWATGAIMRNRVAQAASFGGSAIAAGILAGVRENEQVKIDRADLARRIAEGGKIDENNKYEVGLAETLPEMRTAESYMEAMDQAITSGDADQMRQVLADLVVAREVGRNEGIDLIDYYSGGGDAEAVRNELTSRQFALEQAYIRANEDPNLELGRYKSQLMDGLSVATRAYGGVIQNVNGALLSQGDVPEDVRERINEIYEVQANRDRVADKLRHRRVAKEVATTTARTLAFSTIAQEGLAFIRDDVHGAVEDMLVGQHGDAPNAARTALGNLLNTPNGGVVGEVVAGGNQPEKQFYRSDEVSREQLNEWRAKGFRVDERIEHMPYEHQVTVSAEDAVKGNPTFHRAGWLDYGTERPDYNELLGHHGEGSSYIFNPRGGSYGYGMSMSREDIIQAAREGHIKLMVSPTRGTQSNPFSIGNAIVGDSGSINFTPDSIIQPGVSDMIENRSYALLEVVDTKTGMVLATEVGSGTADSFTRTAKEMVDALTGYDITPPVDQVINSVPAMPDVESLPPVPGYRGTRRLSTDDELFERPAMVETAPEEEVNPPTPTSPSGSLSGSSVSSSSSSSLPSSSSSGSSSFLSNGQSNSNGSGGEQPKSGNEADTPGGSSSALSASSPLSSSSLGDNDVVTASTAAVDNTSGKISGSSEELSENSGAAIDSVANNGAEKKLLVKRRQGESPLSAVAKSNGTSSNAILPSDGFVEAGLRRESESNAPNSREIMTPEEVRAGWFCAFPITPGSNYQLRPELVAQVERNVDDGVLRHKDESLDEIFDDDEVDKDYRIFRLMIPDANRIMYGDPEHSLFAKSKDGKTKLTRLGSNFLRIMEANVYNPLNRPDGYVGEYAYDKDLIKSPAKIAFVYNHHREWETYSCCSELEKELKHSHMKLDDMADVKELFCPWNFKDHKGEEVRTISVTRKGKYAIEDYFDENIAKGEIGGNLNLAGFLDAYSRYSKDEAHVKRWNEKLKDEAQNIAFHRPSIESDLTYEIGPIVYGSSDNDGGIIDSVADKIKSLGKAIQFAQSPQAVIEDRARRFLGDAVELFTVSLREDPPGWGGRSWVGLKMNDAGERAYERYCSESITLSQRWLSQDEVISPFGFINGYNAGKYRDPTPATA